MADPSMTTRLLRERIHLSPPGDEAYRYLPVPFDVPAPGVPGVRVTIAYDQQRARLDFGLWDSDRFRGWSGSERCEIQLGPSGATPGYLPGDLDGGAWAVWLGVYVVAEGGVDVDIAVDIDPSPPSAAPHPTGTPAPRPSRTDLPPGWLAGDLHCHTVHSDGSLSVLEVALLAHAAGLDFLAVTDHNTVSHHPELPGVEAATGITLIPGQEVTSYRGHANAFGPLPWVDFREPASAWRQAVTAGGGVLSVNHPTAGDCAWRQPLDAPPDLIELWHGDWRRKMDGTATEALGYLERLGHPVAVGGSDFHRPGHHSAIGQPTTWVHAPDGDILAGLRAGLVAVSAEATGPVAVIEDGQISLAAAAGTVLCDQGGGRRPIASDRVSLPLGDGIHWLERDGWVEAMCDPSRGAKGC